VRRYAQGLLIRAGHLRAVQWCATARLAAVLIVLAIGFAGGGILAAVALISGALVEAALLAIIAWRAAPDPTDAPGLPSDVRGVARFYWPLASSMIVVWGGRAVLVGVVARAGDGAIALAAWPAAWGLVLLVANATRMVNQVVIRNRGRAPDALLLRFAASVGAAGTACLLVVIGTPLAAFVGHDPELVAHIRPVLLVCAFVPLIVSIQNALQGILIDAGRTGRVNAAAMSGTAVLLVTALGLVAAGSPGATAASIATDISLFVETALLLRWAAPHQISDVATR
jgi:Na+-driven multidrug efflux pump